MKTKIKNPEQNITDEDKSNEYETAKDELKDLYDNFATGVKIRSKCDWYQYVEKSTKYFLNLEKQKAANGTVRKQYAILILKQFLFWTISLFQ